MKFINICIVIWFLASVSLSQDIHFANGKDSLAIPFELVNNQILLKVSFEDSPPLTFAMDTGASFNVLSLELAKKNQTASPTIWESRRNGREDTGGIFYY